MKKTKILEIGAEGGSQCFYKIEEEGVVYFGIDEPYEYQSLEELFNQYREDNGPLLWFFPVTINGEFSDMLVPIIQDEVKQYGRNHFRNLEEWERKLSREIKQECHLAEQTFIIYPVVKEKMFSYNNISDERIPVKETMSYNIEPNQMKEIQGIGYVEGNCLLIRNKKSAIKGIFSLERYEVEVRNKNS